VVAIIALIALPLFDMPLLLSFGKARGFLFAVRVIPMRTMFYLVSALAAAWATLTHRPSRVRRRPLRTQDVNHVVA
jgi:hypothetical protein